MHKVFRFGLPLGSATLCTAILHWLASVRLVVHTFDAFFPRKSLEFEDYVTIICSFVTLLLTILLWTQVIFKGNRYAAFFWFFVAILNCSVQMIQSCYDLSYHKKYSSRQEFYGTLWGLVVSICANIYVYIIGAQMISSFLIEDELNSFRDILRPLGMKCMGVLRYYQGNPRLGSRVMLVADTFWSAFLLIAYELPRYDFGRFDWLVDFGKSEIYFFTGTAARVISAEEIYMRVFRVLIGINGCYLISRRSANLKPWLFCQLCGIAASIIMYIILFAMTKDWQSNASGYIYQLLFTADIVFRFITLHFCIEFKRDSDGISII